MYRYDYKESIRKYLQIIQWFLGATVHTANSHDIPQYINEIEKLIEDTQFLSQKSK